MGFIVRSAGDLQQRRAGQTKFPSPKVMLEFANITESTFTFTVIWTDPVLNKFSLRQRLPAIKDSRS
jgi:hypothetical protein